MAVQTQRCLAALSPATLLTLSTASHPIQLDDSPCANCPLAYAHSAIEETTAHCNDWIEVLPDTPTIRLRSRQMAEPQKTDRRPVFNPTMSPVSRRNLLQSVRKAGEQAAAPPQKSEMIRSGRSVPVPERLPQTLPRQHARLIAAVEQRGRKRILTGRAAKSISVSMRAVVPAVHSVPDSVQLVRSNLSLMVQRLI